MKGIVPRFIEDIFQSGNAKSILLQMNLIENEEVFDLLDPPSVYPAKHIFGYSKTLGALNFISKTVHVGNAAQAKETLGCGLSAACSLFVHKNRPFSAAACHLVTTVVVIRSDETVSVVDFVELADLLYI